MSLYTSKELKCEVKTEEESLEQEVICRLCVEKTSEYSSIFRENLHESLTTHLGLSISMDDNWPKNICSQCRDKSKTCVEFIGIIRQGEISLRNLFGDVSDSPLKPDIELIDIKETPEEEPEDESIEDNDWNNDGEYQAPECEMSVEEEEEEEDTKPLAKRRRKPRKSKTRTLKEDSGNSEEEEEEEVMSKTRSKKKMNVVKITSDVKKEDRKRNRRSASDLEQEDKMIGKFFKLCCQFCGQTFAKYTEFKTHCNSEHNEEASVMCCEKKLVSRTTIASHLNTHINPNPFKCSKCEKTFQTSNGLKLHELNKHVSPEEHIYKCDKCPRTFMTISRLKSHEISHMNEKDKKFKCPHCPRAFALNSMLRQHTRYAHEEANRHVCEICAKVFKSKYTYQIHMNNHMDTGERQFQCSMCEKSFKRKRLLQLHEERHNKDGKIFKCEICGKEAPNNFALKHHMEYSHLKVRKFQCNLCSSAFKTSLGLKEHIATHSSSQILYTCLFCPKQFNSNANKYVHQKRKHPEEYEAMKAKKNLGVSTDNSGNNA